MRSDRLIESKLVGSLHSLLESIFIFEGRIDFLKNKHKDGIDSSHDSLAKHREPHDIIDHFANNADPSKKKIYTQKIVDWYKDKDFRQEDHGRVRQTLKDFEANKKKLPHSDIGKYKSFHHLNSALADFKPKQTNMKWGEFSQDDLDHLNSKGSTVVHDEPKYTVREVHDQKAMDILGKGTKWCVVSNKHRKNPLEGVGADSSYFDHYKEGGDFFHVHDKETGERFLSHHESGQHFFDEGDVEQGHEPEIASKYKEGMAKTLGHLESRDKVRSPFIGQKDLHNMRDDPNLDVKSAVVDHPNTHHDTLHAMRNDTDVKRSIAYHPNTHHKTLHAMRNDTDPFVRRQVAGNTNTHPDTLHAMRNDPNPAVKRRVAKNTNTHHKTLHAMSTDTDPDVRRYVAYNKSTHHKTLHAMSTDPDPHVKRSVAYNKSTHHKTLHAMSTDPDVKRSVAFNTSTHHKTLHAMSTDTDPDVRRYVADNTSTHHETLHAMSTDPDVKRNVAKNTNTHHKTLHSMGTDKNVSGTHKRDYGIRVFVARNKSTHPDTLNAMHTDESEHVRGAVAENTNTHHKTLHAMSTDPDRYVKRYVARNKNTHHETLHAMSTDESNSYLVREIAKSNLKTRGLL